MPCFPVRVPAVPEASGPLPGSGSVPVLPCRRVFPLFPRSLLQVAPAHLPLSLLMAPSAGQDDEEEEHHAGDSAPDGQRQEEQF